MQTSSAADFAELLAWAGQNNIRTLGESPEKLARETSLDLDSDNLTRLPEAIGSMRCLQRLHLRGNPLERLPERFGELQQLEMLNIFGARLTTLPSGFTRLYKLDYCRIEAQLTALPEDFGQLRALTQLHLAENRLTALPDSMADLHQLEHLDLSGNCLTVLPEWIGRLPSLDWLDVRGNPLTELPASLGENQTLRHLAHDASVRNPPQLACIREMEKRPLGLLQATFANMHSHFGHQLPDDDVQHRRRGRLGGDDDGDYDYGHGDVVTYLFGQDERGEYLDFYMCHHLAGDQHIRIYEDGSSERLEVISPFGPGVSDDPIENERWRREDGEEVTRIRAMLKAKGFSSSY